MIKPLIATEDQGSNYLDSLKEVEDIIDSRLQDIILNKNINCGKNSRIYLGDYKIKIQIIFYLEPLYQLGINNGKKIGFKMIRSSDRIFTMKQLIDELIQKYSKNGWDKRLEIIYDSIDINKIIYNEDFIRQMESNFLFSNKEITRTFEIGTLKFLDIKGVIE